MTTSSIRKIALMSLLLQSISCAAALAQSPPFAGLAGSWTGSGSISLSDGSKERLRCKATYQVSAADARLQQSLRCASDSYRFDLNSDIASSGRHRGNMERSEPRHQRQPCRAREQRVHLGRRRCTRFSANLSVTTRGNRQSFYNRLTR